MEDELQVLGAFRCRVECDEAGAAVFRVFRRLFCFRFGPVSDLCGLETAVPELESFRNRILFRCKGIQFSDTVSAASARYDAVKSAFGI